MDQGKQRVESRNRMKVRIRRKVSGTAQRPRLAVFRSLKYIYAQVIDDASGKTIASASSREKDSGAKGANAAAAKAVGALIAKKAQDKGVKQVVFQLGYSHPVRFPIPQGIDVTIDAKTNHITITGIDKQKVGQVAAEIRGLREPDPYKGKGIKYSNEVIRRKAGKAAGK